MPSFSPLAIRAHKLVGHGKRKGKVHGIILHTTGSTIVSKAKAAKVDALKYVVDHYLASDLGPTYVIGHAGTIVQVADEDKVTWHAGVKKDELQAYLTGTWRTKVKAHKQWDDTWNKHGVYDPRVLAGAGERDFLGVNEHFIGIEMPPLVPTPKEGLRFTAEQHEAAGRLCADIMARRGLLGIAAHRVVLTHEDVNPLARFDKAGGWDPGVLRAEPYFNMDKVLKMLGGKR